MTKRPASYRLALACLLASIFVPSAAVSLHAQEQKSLVPAMLSLAHDPDGKPDHFIIRITSRYGQAGCQKVGKVSFGESFSPGYIDITAGGYTVQTEGLPLHPEYQCGGNTVYPSADVPLTMAQIKQNNVQQVRFGNSSNVNYYDLIIGNHFIAMKPAMGRRPEELGYRPMDLPSVLDPLKLWIYPPGTVILHPGSIPAKTPIKAQLDDLARQRGLVPLETVIAGFTSPLEDPNYYYYVDKSKGRQLLKSPSIEQGVDFGVINVPMTVYGAAADETISRPIQILARTPGAYD